MAAVSARRAVAVGDARQSVAARPAHGWIVEALKIYALSRVLVAACAVFASKVVNQVPADGPWPALERGMPAPLAALGRWDGAWYLHVASVGYDPIGYGRSDHASIAFFPGFPALVGLQSRLTVLGALVAVLAWRLVADLSGAAAARRATTLLCFAPGSFVFSMAYSESLFLLTSIACVWFLVRQSWNLAGVAGALASFTRPNGVVLVVTCAVVAAVAVARTRHWRALLAPALAASGVTAYFAYLTLRRGDTMAWFVEQRRGWGDRVAPIEALVNRVEGLVTNGVSLDSGGLNDVIWFAGVGFAALALVLLMRWRPPLPLMVYGIAATVFAASSLQVGLRPRMVLGAFPLILAAGVELRGVPYRALFACSVLSLVALSLLTFGTLAATP
jgi:hypothetical protein